MYRIKLPIFEGPLDLLLYLIRKEEINIYDIPIAKVTEQYISYLDLMQMLDLDIAGEFLVMAATLIQIKSKMLLPTERLEVEEEEEGDIRAELVQRLLEYQKFKEAAEYLAEKEGDRRRVYTRSTSLTSGSYNSEEERYFEASLFDLISAFSKILKETPKKETFHEIIEDTYTVEGKIQHIIRILTQRHRIFFTELFEDLLNKEEIIATFLALLELIKLKEIIIVQKEAFGEIEIINKTNDK